MSRYFKINEIDADSFINATGDDLNGRQLVISTDEGVFVAVDDSCEDEISVDLDCFD